jgi:hypothetical protein
MEDDFCGDDKDLDSECSDIRAPPVRETHPCDADLAQTAPTTCAYDKLATREEIRRYLEGFTNKDRVASFMSNVRVSDKTAAMVDAKFQKGQMAEMIEPVDIGNEIPSIPIRDAPADPNHSMEVYCSAKLGKVIGTIASFSDDGGEVAFTKEGMTIAINDIKHGFYVYFTVSHNQFIRYYCAATPIVFKVNLSHLANMFTRPKGGNVLLMIRTAELGHKIRLAHGDSGFSTDTYECATIPIDRGTIENKPDGHFRNTSQVTDLSDYDVVLQFTPAIFSAAFHVRKPNCGKFVATVGLDKGDVYIHMSNLGAKTTKRIAGNGDVAGASATPGAARILKYNCVRYANVTFPLNDIRRLHKLSNVAREVRMYISCNKPIVVEYMIDNANPLRLFVLVDGAPAPSVHAASAAPPAAPTDIADDDDEPIDDEPIDDE